MQKQEVHTIATMDNENKINIAGNILIKMEQQIVENFLDEHKDEVNCLVMEIKDDIMSAIMANEGNLELDCIAVHIETNFES